LANIVYDIASRANLSGFNQAEQAIDQMTGAQVRWNATANRWQSESGRFVAANRVVTRSASSAAAGIGKMALGLAGGAGLTVALIASNALLEKGSKIIGDYFDKISGGRRELAELRKVFDSIIEVQGPDGKKVFGGIDELKAEIAVRKQLIADSNEFDFATKIRDKVGEERAQLAREFQEVAKANIPVQKEFLAALEAELVVQERLKIVRDVAGVDGNGEGDGTPEKKRVTLVQKLNEEYEDLLQRQEDINAVGIEAIVILEEQIEKLKMEMAIQKQFAQLVRDGDAMTVIPGLTPGALDDGDDALERQREQMNQELAQISAHRDELRDQQAAMERTAEQAAANLNQIIAVGLADVVGSVGQGGGALTESLANTAEAVGRFMITTGGAFKLFEKLALSPGTAIIAGISLIVLARALHSQAAGMVSDGVSGGSATGPQVYVTNSSRSSRSQLGFPQAGQAGQGGGSPVFLPKSTAGYDVNARLVTVLERLDRDGLRGTLTSERGAFKAELQQQSIRNAVGGDVRFYH
jgi:hypothetical protein